MTTNIFVRIILKIYIHTKKNGTIILTMQFDKQLIWQLFIFIFWQVTSSGNQILLQCAIIFSTKSKTNKNLSLNWPSLGHHNYCIPERLLQVWVCSQWVQHWLGIPVPNPELIEGQPGQVWELGMDEIAQGWVVIYWCPEICVIDEKFLQMEFLHAWQPHDNVRCHRFMYPEGHRLHPLFAGKVEVLQCVIINLKCLHTARDGEYIVTHLENKWIKKWILK